MKLPFRIHEYFLAVLSVFVRFSPADRGGISPLPSQVLCKPTSDLTVGQKEGKFLQEDFSHFGFPKSECYRHPTAFLCQPQFQSIGAYSEVTSNMTGLFALLGLSLSQLASLVGTLLLTLLFWRRYCSPISDIPGPFTASFTRIWHVLHILKGDQNLELIRLHDKHGGCSALLAVQKANS